MAAAGVDGESNTTDGTLLLLPIDTDDECARDPHACAPRWAATWASSSPNTAGARVGGATAIAIGGSGVRLLDDLRGQSDAHGRRLDVTAPAVGDELAAAADLIKGKSSGTPVAVIRGLDRLLDAAAEGARVLQRPTSEDLFSLGTAEAREEGRRAARGADLRDT